MTIHVTPIPRLTTLVAPAFTLGTANAAGAAITAVASNSTLLVYDTTLPAQVGTPAVGSATTAARRDHVHGATSTSSVAKAWCNVDADGTLNSPSFNMTSITRNSTGNYTCTWATDFSSVEYVTLATTSDTEGGCRTGGVGTRAAGLNKVFTSNSSFSATDSSFNVVAYGDQ